MRSPLGRLILDRVALHGVTTLRRFSSGAVWGPKDTLGVESTAQFDSASPAHAIDVHDLYFSYRGVRDRFSGQPGYLFIAEILLHECVHVLDDGKGSLAMARLAGFSRSSAGWRFSILTAEDAMVFNTISAAVERAQAGDRSVDMSSLNRSLALKLRPTRVPSIRATPIPPRPSLRSARIWCWIRRPAHICRPTSSPISTARSSRPRTRRGAQGAENENCQLGDGRYEVQSRWHPHNDSL